MNELIIRLNLSAKRSITIEIYSETSTDDVFLVGEEEARENGESPYQILEGHSYEYGIEKGFVLEQIGGIVIQSKKSQNQGRIVPGIYVGTLTIGVIEEFTGLVVTELKLEVCSVKTSYRSDYRLMLEEITEKCTELILQPNSPVSQYFTSDFNVDSRTLYQRFVFIKSILESSEFVDAVNRFLQSPITQWADTEIEKDIRKLKRIGNKDLRQFAATGNRANLPDNHYLAEKLPTVPSKIKTYFKRESVDTPENRFIRYALVSFLFVCTEIRGKSISKRLNNEVALLESKLEGYLSHSIFSEISFPNLLPLNSPVLQRRAGYREILRAWLMFDLGAKLIWRGGDDVYSGNKRDVATLYEYWLFFKLLDMVVQVFKLENMTINNLIEKTKDGLGLKLKQGKYLPIKGVYKAETRSLNIEFSYNRTFYGQNEYPNEGSWSKNLRPDYTLSIWPYGVDSKTAEEQELIVHIHFDAKYRVENLKNILGGDDDLSEEKLEQARGTFKRADLLKMHTYKDAIRRTAGAYVLYPGTESRQISGFHEILPGLGAFAIRPDNVNDGSEALKQFIKEVVSHFLNRVSQREKMALKTYEVHKGGHTSELKEVLPELIGEKRSFLPDEVSVLVGFYKGDKHLSWILNHKLYNVRSGDVRGSLRLDVDKIGAKYLLLHSFSETKTSKLLKFSNKGPRIFSQQDMIKKGYPDPRNDFYLIYDIDDEAEIEFQKMSWDISKLSDYSSGRNSAFPFTVSLMELMKVLVK
ncbi:DUF2357 domain-containing protein [Flavisolibacter sp. BT320]|nr:DUF2357 domain-containing protein [Flavisolibacter longurius]